MDTGDVGVQHRRHRPSVRRVSGLTGLCLELRVLLLGGAQVVLDTVEPVLKLPFLRAEVVDDPRNRLPVFLCLFEFELEILYLCLYRRNLLAGGRERRLGLLFLVLAATGLVDEAVLLALELVFLRLRALQVGLSGLELVLYLLELLADLVDAGLDSCQPGLPFLDIRRHRGLLDLCLPDLGLQFVHGLLFAVERHECLPALGLGVLDSLALALDLALQPGDVTLYLLYLPLESELFVLALALYLGAERLEFLLDLHHRGLALVESRLPVGQPRLRVVDIGRNFGELRAAVLEFGRPAVTLVSLSFLAQLLILERRLALVGELFQPRLLLLDP